MNEKWDYKVVRINIATTNIEKELKTLGQDGWELISATASQTLSVYMVILKRKL
jgi:hypothetical protein